MRRFKCPQCGFVNTVPTAETDARYACEQCHRAVLLRPVRRGPENPAETPPLAGGDEGSGGASLSGIRPHPLPELPHLPDEAAPNSEGPAGNTQVGSELTGEPRPVQKFGAAAKAADGNTAGKKATQESGIPRAESVPDKSRSGSLKSQPRELSPGQSGATRSSAREGAQRDRPPAVIRDALPVDDAIPEPLSLDDHPAEALPLDDRANDNSSRRTSPNGPGQSSRRGRLKFAIMGIVFVAIAGGAGTAWLLLNKKKTEVANSLTPADAKPAVPTLASSAADTRTEFKPEEIAERLMPSTVLVTTTGGIGSGVLVHREPNVVLTNWHVVEDAKNKTATVFFPDRDQKNKVITRMDHYRNKDTLLGIPGKVVMHDPERDIAMLQLDRVPDSAVPVPLAAESAKQLERVFGNGQSGVDYNALWQSNEGSCRQLVDDFPLRGGSGVSRVLLTSQPINPGDSGGPVVNSRLELVGIVRAKASKYISVLEKSKGLRVEGLDNFSIIIDVEELRAHLNDGFRLAFKSTFINPTNTFAAGAGGGASGRPAAKRRTVEELITVLEVGTPHQVTLAMTEISEHGAAAVPQLIAMLGNTQQRGNWPKVLEALERIGTPAAQAVDAAIACLGDDFIKTRIAAARFLGSVPEGKRALPELWRAVANNDSTLRQTAKASIERHGPYGQQDRPQLRQLAGIPNNKNPFVKAFYVSLLHRMLDMSAKEFSEQVLDKDVNIFEDNDQRLRYFIAQLIKDNPDRFTRADKFRCLIPQLGDEDPEVQQLAREVLDEMTWDQKKEMQFNDSEGKPLKNRAGQPIVLPGYELADKMAPWSTTLYETTPTEGKRFYQDNQGRPLNLQKIRNTKQEDVDILLQYIKETTPPEGVVFAMQLIQQMRGRGQVDFSNIKVFLDMKKFSNIKVQAATLLMIIDQKKPIDPMLDQLIELSRHQNSRIRSLAILCLALVQKEAVTILKVFFDGLEDADADIREAAQTALGACLASRLNRFEGDGDLKLARDTLVQSKQAAARTMAARVLANVRGKADTAAQELVRALDDPDLDVRTAAVQSLGFIGAAAGPGVVKIGELLLHELDSDVAKLIAGGLKPESPQRAGLLRNELLRQEALKALANLKEQAQGALPALSKFITKTTVQEHLVLAAGAIKSIVRDPEVNCDQGLVNGLVKLFENEMVVVDFKGQSVLNVIESLEHLLEINNGKRSPVSSAVLDAFKEMGPRALPFLREFLFTKKGRPDPSTDGLQIIGAVEAVIVIASRDGFKIDRGIQDKLMSTLDAMVMKHNKWLIDWKTKSFPPRSIEMLSRFILRMKDALRLLGKAPLNKN